MSTTVQKRQQSATTPNFSASRVQRAERINKMVRKRSGRAAVGITPEGNSADELYVVAQEVRARYSITDMTIWRWVRDPRVAFPEPTKLGANHINYWWLPAL